MAIAGRHDTHPPQDLHETVRQDADLAARIAIENARPEERVAILNRIIASAAKRLGAVVDTETEALRRGAQTDLKAFNSLKSVGLVELNRAIQLLDKGKPDASTLQLLEKLNQKLETNRRVLKLHLEAVNEIAGIISDSIRQAESDGTYTSAFRSKGRTP